MNLRDLLMIPEFFPFHLGSNAKKEENKPLTTNSYLNREASAQLYDELDYQRAVQAYIWAIPLVSFVAFSKALERAGVSSSEPSLLIFDRPLTPKQLIMTANSETIYAFTVLDLAKLGAVVVEAPSGILGAVTDIWQRALVDIGVGPTIKGGSFLLIPPKHKGEIPDGYIPVRCPSNHVQLGVRGIIKPGDTTEPYVKLISGLKIYPISHKPHPKQPRIVLNGDEAFDSDWPKDARYFEYLAEGLVHEVINPVDKLMYGMLSPLGIEPGKPFKPNSRIFRILDRAARTGTAMVENMAFANRFEGRQLWPDRQWEKVTFATSPDFENDQTLEIDERAQAWYQVFGNIRYLYDAKPTPGQGSWYASTFRDKDGLFLDGFHTYWLHLNSEPPAKNFWSVTVYDNRTRSQIDTNQHKASLSTYSKIHKNNDGSIDFYFAPTPPPGMRSNWIKTIPGQGFFVMFRIYGPFEQVLNKIWQLQDIDKVKDRFEARL